MPSTVRGSLDLLIAATLALAFLFATAAIALTYLSANRYAEQTEWVEQGRVLSQTLQALLSALQDVETGARGYAITGDEGFLQPYRDALGPIEAELARARELTADDARQRAHLAEIERLAAERVQAAAAVVRARGQQGEQASLDLVRTSTGKQLMDAIRVRIQAMQHEQLALLRARQEGVAAAARRAWWAFGALTGVIVILLGGLVHLARREATAREVALADLERLVGERTAALTRAGAELRRSETMAALGALVSGVAHQVRNPLFSISAALDALEARQPAQAETRRHFEVMRSELTRLNALMQELLEYARPPAVTFVPGQLATVLADALRACQPLAEHTGVSLPPAPPPTVAQVAMDRPRLAVLFENLLTNAIHMAGRGGHVEVAIGEVEADGRTWIECAVRDSGPGFLEEDMARAFEPFFSKRAGGTGLGLAIVRRCAEQHGGSVHIVNRPGGGAEVAVRLPPAETPVAKT